MNTGRVLPLSFQVATSPDGAGLVGESSPASIEINWSHVIREHVRGVLDDLERMDDLAAESTLSEADVADLADMIDTAAAERAERDRPRVD